MEAKLTFQYDREGDILYINKRPPYTEQESEELGDEVIARLNPKTREIENLEVLFFSTRLLRSDLFELPITADLRLARKSDSKPVRNTEIVEFIFSETHSGQRSTLLGMNLHGFSRDSQRSRDCPQDSSVRR
jgi:uncharacterized protein YuzE